MEITTFPLVRGSSERSLSVATVGRTGEPTWWFATPVGQLSGSKTTPLVSSWSISGWVKSSSARTSTVCWPSNGDGRRSVLRSREAGRRDVAPEDTDGVAREILGMLET